MAIAKGMHTQMLTEYLEEKSVQHRGMTSLIGLTQSLSDEYVDTLLPTSSGSIHRMAGVKMHIKLYRMIAKINSSSSREKIVTMITLLIQAVYAFDGRLNRIFINCTKSALANIASMADELRDKLLLQLD
ncbi:hypothetical protein N7495_007502 [Penicillium taxi]|uniref:uncharacterized protein n=1 Tax=Penicillium taxi TaxID=168475 RepID=UPI0025459978|nr:uncharacterized protein N7495_007502 [Penicillium taxi]KAJ5887461.1 hypothetical protein N7495_007502 [Penicillium taxi]